MPVTFSQIANNTAVVTLPFGDDAVHITYYPNKITDKVIADLQANPDANEMLTEIIKSWDVMEDEDQSVMFPISRIAEFGLPFKIQVIEAIVGAMRPNSQTA